MKREILGTWAERSLVQYKVSRCWNDLDQDTNANILIKVCDKLFLLMARNHSDIVNEWMQTCLFQVASAVKMQVLNAYSSPFKL